MDHSHTHYANAALDSSFYPWVSDASFNNVPENDGMQCLADFDASGHWLESSNIGLGQFNNTREADQQDSYGRSFTDSGSSTIEGQYDCLSQNQYDFSTTQIPDLIQMDHFDFLNGNEALETPPFGLEETSPRNSHLSSNIPYMKSPSSTAHSTTTNASHREQDRTSDHGIEKHATIGSLLTNGKFVCSDKGCARLTFGRSTELKRHHTTHHSVDKVEFWCHVPFCKRSRSGKGKPFYRKDKLNCHVHTVHSGV